MTVGQSLAPTRGHGPRVVALGGGHGLAATLQALRQVTDALTAVVGVADDGGSSGRLRREFGVLPPGDLRMALAALCADDDWGRTWASVVQHRFGGLGDLAGHSVGNLLITALWEETGSAVEGLDWLAALLNCRGRVLPCSTVPLEIVGEVREGASIREVHGQVAVATTAGEVISIRLEPADPPACPQALEAIGEADVVVLGPGSWFTSVLPHLAIKDQREALVASSARKVVVLNVDPSGDLEMAGRALDAHLDVLARAAAGLRIDVVLADPQHVDDHGALRRRCDALGAQLVLAPVAFADDDHPGQHDPRRLGAALRQIVGQWQDVASWR